MPPDTEQRRAPTNARRFWPFVFGHNLELEHARGLAFVARDELEVTEGAALVAIGKEAEIERGAAAMVVGTEVELEEAVAGVVIAGEAEIEDSFVAVMLARRTKIEGDVRVLLTPRELIPYALLAFAYARYTRRARARPTGWRGFGRRS